MSNIYDKIYGSGGEQVVEKQEEKEEQQNKEANSVVIPFIVTIVSIVCSAFCLIAFSFAFSYKLCLFLDEYFIYISAVIGLGLAYSLFMSIRQMVKKFKVLALINIIFSLAALVLVIIPYFLGLIYF